ncbi:MAG: transglycosylase domain-containing protein, partial [Candidatus Cloacimonetes bacterium]|nr:transglycosylase domain-containing protein [Candidatus Cloacimonadota bacterium]
MKQLLVLILVSGLFGLFLYFPLPSLKQPSTSQLITDKNGVPLRVILNQNGDIHLPLKSIPPLVKQAVLAFEDQYFEWHFGINPFSVLRAMWHNLWGKSRIGASTISMQVIRMQTRNQRTLANKLLETLYALQLEWQYEKEEILLQWLNLTPYGSNIIGMETASWLYFGKPLAHLGMEQVLMLSVLPKNPNPSQKQLKTSINRLCKQLKITPYSIKWIDEFFTGKRFKRPPLPYRAAHFTHLPVFDSYPKNESIIQSSLDYNLQLDLNNTLRSLVESHQNLAVTHASGMLLELSSMKILAWAGSQNYFGPLGKNDLNLALRSPGSTLKPLIYTQAFEEGILIPDSQLLDIPQGFSGYFPKNFDRGFKGLISAREALQQSLNIPAIEIELELKTRLHQILKTINPQGLHPEPDHYGTSLVLGG